MCVCFKGLSLCPFIGDIGVESWGHKKAFFFLMSDYVRKICFIFMNHVYFI